MTRLTRLSIVVAVALVATVGGRPVRPAPAGLPGYFEWVLWREIESPSHRIDFEWVVGPYPRQLDCEQERDRATRVRAPGSSASEPIRRAGPESAGTLGPVGPVTIRLICLPDTTNPREVRPSQ